MHYVQAKSILSKNNSMNLYRGCSHGCIYCDSRSNVYNMQHEFEDIEVKQNSLELLRKALQNKKEKCVIGTGSMTDPYIPQERKLRYLRRSLELISQYGHGFTCITKSDMVLRDIDLFEKINSNAKAVVQMTLTCLDDEVSKIIEPNICTTNRRIEVLETLHDAGIPTVVWLCPILPYITDSPENIGGIIDRCADVGVNGIVCFDMGMTLRDGNREHYYDNLDKHFPGLREVYQEKYGTRYSIPCPKRNELMKLFNRKTREYGLLNKPEEIFSYIGKIPSKKKSVQTKLF
ncbi:MAG: radical SAM protein [Methanosphaera sp. rholeuAM6]|nr:MAG: radical SAM protein [Methanosphaera sp. rholeuAM6]